MERALLVFIALLLGAVAMDPRIPGLMSLWHVPARVVRVIERKLNRDKRTLNTRITRGWILLWAVVLGALGLGVVAGAFSRLLGSWVDVAVLAACLPVRPAYEQARQILHRLNAHDTAAARLVLKDTVWRHYAVLDPHALARAGVEILAVTFADKIVAPVFWYLVFGLPGLLVAKAVVLLEENLCQPISVESAFGRPSFLMHRVTHFIPSRLAALVWVAVMPFLQQQRFFAAAKQSLSGFLAATPEEMAVLAAASVLGLALGGPTSVYTEGKWYGHGSARAQAVDTSRAIYLYVLANTVLLLVVAVLF